MALEDGTERILKFRRALHEVFKSEDGKIVMKFLKEVYVDSPALDSTSELTYYKLGQKEFVQGLMKDASTSVEELKSLMSGGK